MKADLHIHSIYSDGKLTPKELVQLATDKKIDCISLTDHDSCEGTELIQNEGKKNNIQIISGIELSSYIDKKEIHILGYFIDPKHPVLSNKLKDLRVKRKSRILKMIDKLSSLGINITLKDVEKHCKKGLYGRLHVARALYENNFIKSTDEAFIKFIGNHGPAYVAKDRLEALEAIDMIKKAGGIAVIAHPGSSGLLKTEIKRLIDIGIKGIEIFHPKHHYKQENELLNLCKQENVFVTGGSDFHGYEDYEFEAFGLKFTEINIVKQMERALPK